MDAIRPAVAAQAAVSCHEISFLTGSFSQSRFEAALRLLPALFFAFRAALYRLAILLDYGGSLVMVAACVLERSLGLFSPSVAPGANLCCGSLFLLTLLFALALLFLECDSRTALCLLVVV